MTRRIETLDDVAEGAAWLGQQDARFARVLALTGPWPLRRHDDGFPALLDAIIGQQVSTAAARTIAARMQAANLWHESDIAAATEDALRAAGLSRPKARYAQALARSGLDWPALRDLPDEAVIARLTALPGIGRWTAEIYAMFALGRPDVLAAGDLALQESAKHLFDLPARPDDRALRALAHNWSPWRAVAARGLWAYYRHLKSREGVR
jgi:DNA-3-methyladenine glycosylase II